MCAVLICTHTFGGDLITRIARPSARVASTRDRRIASQLSGVLMQSTDRPARFTTPHAPSSRSAHAPSDRPSHFTDSHVPLTRGAARLTMMTRAPSSVRCRASEIPRNPDPPRMTMGAGKAMCNGIHRFLNFQRLMKKRLWGLESGPLAAQTSERNNPRT